jgi:hypothetical protein
MASYFPKSHQPMTAKFHSISGENDGEGKDTEDRAQRDHWQIQAGGGRTESEADIGCRND